MVKSIELIPCLESKIVFLVNNITRARIFFLSFIQIIHITLLNIYIYKYLERSRVTDFRHVVVSHFNVHRRQIAPHFFVLYVHEVRFVQGSFRGFYIAGLRKYETHAVCCLSYFQVIIITLLFHISPVVVYGLGYIEY